MTTGQWTIDMSVPGAAKGPLKRAYDIVIVGAGIQGLALAYELTARGVRDVCVLDAGYPGGGASGRNGEMIRSAFSTTQWCGLFDVSLRKWHTLTAELDYDVAFTAAGHVTLASDADGVAKLVRHNRLHSELGIDTRLLDPAEMLACVPALNPQIVAGGLYQPDAGFAHHDSVIWGYAAAAARGGAQIHPDTTVTALEYAGSRITGVRTSRGDVAAGTVVVAAGADSRDILATAELDIPTTKVRLEALVTESLTPFIRPAVSLKPLLGYCHQTTRGEFVGGTEQRVTAPGSDVRTTMRALRDACQKFVTAFPRLAGVRVVRSWAGVVDMTSDVAPIVGRAPGVDGLWINCGWTYGFMGAPGTGLLLAEAITTGDIPSALSVFGLERLREGRPIAEDSLVFAHGEHS